MNHEHTDGPALSPEGLARKRAMLPDLQRQLGRRRVRREAVRGGVAVGVVALVAVGGALLSLRSGPAPVAPVIEPPRGELVSGDGADEAPRSSTIVVVWNDPGIVERCRIGDDELLEQLRSAGYRGGLVRMGDRVLVTEELPAPPEI